MAKTPHMPDTPQRRHLARDRGIRQIVFGVQDGVLTTLGIVTGVGASAADHSTVVLTGLVAITVGALSMGVGDFLGGRTEKQVLESALSRERIEMRDNPAEEFAEQVGFYRQKGFTPEEADMIVRRLQQNPEIWVHEMMRDEFGFDVRDIEESGLRPALAMGASFAGGGMLPMLPYLFSLAPNVAVALGALLSALVLFSIGCVAGRLSGRNPVLAGAEILGAGALVYIASYAVGHLVPALFGHPPISAG